MQEGKVRGELHRLANWNENGGEKGRRIVSATKGGTVVEKLQGRNWLMILQSRKKRGAARPRGEYGSDNFLFSPLPPSGFTAAIEAPRREGQRSCHRSVECQRRRRETPSGGRKGELVVIAAAALYRLSFFSRRFDTSQWPFTLQPKGESRRANRKRRGRRGWNSHSHSLLVSLSAYTLICIPSSTGPSCSNSAGTLSSLRKRKSLGIQQR